MIVAIVVGRDERIAGEHVLHQRLVEESFHVGGIHSSSEIAEHNEVINYNTALAETRIRIRELVSSRCLLQSSLRDEAPVHSPESVDMYPFVPPTQRSEVWKTVSNCNRNTRPSVVTYYTVRSHRVGKSVWRLDCLPRVAHPPPAFSIPSCYGPIVQAPISPLRLV